MKEWPELVGKTKEEAKELILKECPDVQVDYLPEGSMVTMDFNEKRVRIFITEEGVVAVKPRTG
ncbi:uncharacterized protein LOC144438962 [Glandiceps talaboti]